MFFVQRSPRAVQGSIPGRKWSFFSTLQHPWHPHFWDSNMPLYMHNFYGQAESGGSLLKIDLCTMLCSKKTFNFESFEFPSWEFKNIFWGVYPHQTCAPCTICIPPNRKGHIGPSFLQGEKYDFVKSLNLVPSLDNAKFEDSLCTYILL